MRLCRDCEQWHTTKQWRGNCWKHPWERDKYSETASVPDCRDYTPKVVVPLYQVAAKGG